MVYYPEEDSYLLSGEIEKFLKKIDDGEKEKLMVLDMGTGTGIQAETCLKYGIRVKNILAVDKDSEAIKIVKAKKIKTLRSDLFSKLTKKQTFDLIVFNAPYLPEDKDEPKDSRLATTAGKRGNEIILKFLKQAKNHLNEGGKIFLLFSSFSKPKEILSYAKKLGYSHNLLVEKSLFFEKLFIYEFLNN